MHLFYSLNIENNSATLSLEESGHCVRVLRLGKGDTVQLIDGKGNLFEAVITNPDHKKCTLEITRSLPVVSPRNFNLHIAIAPTKHIDRFEWFVEKAIEIGIDTITPLLCQRSERRVLKTERIHKLIISTMKQAMVTSLPVFNELTDYRKFLNTFNGFNNNRFIAHCEDSPKKQLSDAISPGSDIIILIGPEGDFSHEEIDFAVAKQFIPVSLSRNRLRTETAGIVACSTAVFMSE